MKAVGLVVAMTLVLALAGCARPWATSGERWGDRPPEPAREYRGAWVASVVNIDWPSKPGLDAAAQAAEIRAIVDRAADAGLNALFVQVRPTCDAVYRSPLEPWSEFLSGVQGQASAGDDGTYDPLRTWISEGRRRGVEIHAWINPFRAKHVKSTSPLSPDHIAVRRPDLVRAYDGYLWLDPGEPEAVAHTFAVIDDLVARYDLDGVHYDDYFYPYPKTGIEFPDETSYAKYLVGGGTLPRDDWRRANIDGFVRSLYERVKRAKPWVRVSASPFGIWRPGFPPGVAGFDAYAGLHADSRRWLREGWVDMLIPQLYWKIEAPRQGYEPLLAWWQSQNPLGRQVIAGNYLTRINDSEQSWEAPEILAQIMRTREAPSADASGNVLFSMIGLMQNRRGVTDLLRAGPYARAALPPGIAWSARGSPARAPALRAEVAGDQVALSWETAGRDDVRSWVLSFRAGERWTTTLYPAGDGSPAIVTLPLEGPTGRINAASLAAVDRYGRLGPPRIVRVVGGD
jgi:uncharacterized lipoprotein YddW (UPF0748 family)